MIPAGEVIAAPRTILEISEELVRLRFGECSRAREMPKRRLHEPSEKGANVLRQLDLRHDGDLIEPKVPEPAWKFSYNQAVS